MAAIDSQEPVLVIERPKQSKAINEQECFNHRYTGVKLCARPDWNVGQPNTAGVLADIFLWKENVSVMVFWGRTHTAERTESAMLAKDLSERREVYGNRVSDPQRVRVGKKTGYRYTISPPLFGANNPAFRRVVYLFYVDSLPVVPLDSPLHGKYTISVWITGEETDLKLVGEVLHCIRWK